MYLLFYVRIPMMPQHLKRLLFVDDEEGIRLTLAEIFREHGFDVKVASTVPQAVEVVSSALFDVLITDLNISSPGDGFDVIEAMRKAQPDCIKLILTGYPDFDTALRAIRSGAEDYFTKPADVEALLAAVDEKLARKSSKAHLGHP